MKITETKEVEKTVCDMCGRDISFGMVHGLTSPNGLSWDICDYYPGTAARYKWQLPEHMQTLQKCEDRAKMIIAIDSGDKYLA